MNKSILYILVGLIAVGVGYYALTTYKRSATVSNPSQTTSSATTATIQESTAAYTIDAQYPQFGIPAVDVQIKKAFDDAIAEVKALPQNPADSATPKNEFTGRFDKVYIGPDIVSAELILSQYSGGAHPITLLSGVNYDRASGRLLLLDDALKMIGLTVDQLSAQASAKLATKLGDAFMFPDGANTDPENFSSFIVSADSVTFIFQEYQVAAYSEGAQLVSFLRVK